jgi:predicted secreted protein
MICRIREAISPSTPKGPVDEIPLDETSSMTANVGDTVRVELKRSGGTGYEWQLSKESQPIAPVLKADFDAVSGKGRAEAQENGMPGGPVLDVFDFTASTKGSTRLVFVLVRSWEMDKPADRRELMLTVVGGSDQ